MEEELRLYIGSRYVSLRLFSLPNTGANCSIVHHASHLFHSLCPLSISLNHGDSRNWAKDLPCWNYILLGNSYDGIRSCLFVRRLG